MTKERQENANKNNEKCDLSVSRLCVCVWECVRVSACVCEYVTITVFIWLNLRKQKKSHPQLSFNWLICQLGYPTSIYISCLSLIGECPVSLMMTDDNGDDRLMKIGNTKERQINGWWHVNFQHLSVRQWSSTKKKKKK